MLGEMGGVKPNLFLVCLLCAWLGSRGVPQWYLQERQRILAQEESERIGGTLRLNDQEQKVNKILMYEKRKEIENSRLHGALFPPAINFFQAKKLIDQSKIFRTIQRMPKGAALHVHDSAMTSLHWLIKNATYRPDCYMCMKYGRPRFHFYKTHPNNQSCQWKTVNAFRQEYGNATAFDQLLFNNFSIIVDNPETIYVTIDQVWKKFVKYFGMVHGLMDYTPIREEFFYEGLKEFYDDNVQYLEIRSSLPWAYDLNGTRHDRHWTIRNFKDVGERFVRDYPDFSGVKLIHTTSRAKTSNQLLYYLQDAIQLQKLYPDFYVGFDIVGQEDHGTTLLSLADDFFYPENQDPPVDLPYFFHAGETDWDETKIDENLIDAVLLNTTRIGHGYALHKHPEVMKLVKEREIAIEVNPISNQVLKLVGDLRNHPAGALVAQNYPIVISSDDPGVWDAKPLSHDFYEAFMALAGEDADLTFLKQIAMNSIKYSGMSSLEKKNAMSLWQRKWDNFIADVVHTDLPDYTDLFG